MKRNIAALLALVFVVVMSLFAIGCTAEEAQYALDALDSIQSEAESAADSVDERTKALQEAESDYDSEADDGYDDISDDGIDPDGSYTDPDDVALYIYTYGELPNNFITKKDAEALGWDSSKGNLWDVADGMSIGGSVFGNREGILPSKSGRTWYECDVNYEGGYRGAERIVYSSDGLIYYTNDHYKTFSQLY